MIDYTLYDPFTGRIIGGGCHPETIPQHAIRGNWDGTQYYIVSGNPVPFPLRPSGLHYFDFAERAWVLDTESAWGEVRRARDARLTKCDWTTLPDVPLNEAQRTAWAAYRQALRDITEQPDPLAIKWPDPPQ